jgi:dipeptide/tripeptide permease
MINVGAGVSFGFLVNITTSEATSTFLGWGFFKCYVIAAAAMGIAVLSFLAGTCRYKKEPPTVHKPMISVICKYLCRSAARSGRGAMAAIGWLLIPIYITLNLIGSIANDATTTNTCMVMCIVSSAFLVLGHMNNDWIVEFSEEIQGAGVSLLDAKKVLRLVPQLLLINIGFNIPYNAMNNAYPALACQMDLRLPWNDKTQLNGAFTNLGDCLAIIVGVPIIESIIYPCIERRRKRAIPRKVKYVIGFLLACAANGVAIILEDVRRTRGFVPGDDGVSKCAPTKLKIHMSEMSCFYAFIPMFMTGIGEILVNPVVYEFAFAEAPSQLLSVVQAFNLVVAGSISNCITGPLSILVFPSNLNNFDEDNPLSGIGGGRGDVNITFILNIVFGLLCLVAYLLVEKYDEMPPEDTSLERKNEGEQPLRDGEEPERVLG